MKIELSERGEACDVSTRGTVVQVAERLRAMAARFPAVLHGTLSLADQGVVSATSFATMIIIGRSMSPEYLGMYYLVVSIVVIAVGIEEQIVAAPFTVYSKRHQGADLAVYAGSAWVHHFALTVLGTLTLVATIGMLALAGATQIVPALWALLCAGPFLLLRDWIRRFCYANLRIASAVVLDVIVATVQLGGLLLLWHFGRMSLLGIFAVMGAAAALAASAWFISDRPQVTFEHNRFWADWTRNWSFGRWALQSFVVGNTTPYIMPWILGIWISTAAAGVLGACVTLVNFANLFVISVDRILTPRAAHAFHHSGRSELTRVLKRAASILLPALAAFCVLMFVAGSRLAVLAYGDQFAGLGATLSALAVVVFMNGASTVVGNGLWAIDQPRFNFIADITTLVATIVATVLLVPQFNVLGAALAMLIGTSLGCAVRSFRLWRALSSLDASPEVRIVPQVAIGIEG